MTKIAGIFPIGDTGEEFVIAEWVPDPDVLAEQLLSLAERSEDWSVPLTGAREAFIYDTALHFESESDPYGRKWTPLDENYLFDKLAAGYPENILNRTGDLERAATSQEAWMITDRDIVFRADALPFYGPYHQAGTVGEGITSLLGELRTKRSLSSKDINKVSFGGMGRGNNLPQRMFIGADEDTIAEVEEIFVDWINKLIDEELPRVGGGIVGELTMTTGPAYGLFGTLTGVSAFGGGYSVRGPGGRFIGVNR